MDRNAKLASTFFKDIIHSVPQNGYNHECLPPVKCTSTSRDAVHTYDNYIITWDSQIAVKYLLQKRLLIRVGHITDELVESVGSCYKDKVLLRARDPVEFQSCDGCAVSLTDVKHL